MGKESLETIIEFAIEKEQEAMDFYEELAGKVTKSEVAEGIRKLAEMERGHRDRLKNLDLEAAGAPPQKTFPDMQIADYVVEEPLRADMSWQDIITVAMHRELASMRLYQDLAKLFSDPKAVNLFETLSQEEAGHKHFFEKIWDEKVLTEN